MPLPHELSARTPTTSTAYRSAESCTGQRPEMPVLMLRPYSSAESSASPAAHKDADKRIGLHGRLDHPPNLGSGHFALNSAGKLSALPADYERSEFRGSCGFAAGRTSRYAKAWPLVGEFQRRVCRGPGRAGSAAFVRDVVWPAGILGGVCGAGGGAWRTRPPGPAVASASGPASAVVPARSAWSPTGRAEIDWGQTRCGPYDRTHAEL